MQWLSGSAGDWVLLALALYGLASALEHGADLLRAFHKKGQPVRLSLLVLTRNQEEQIEGFVRDLLALISRDGTVCELVLADLASTDGTPAILERLAREERVRLMRLPSDEPGPALEAAHFLCTGKVAMVVDMRGKVDAPALLHTLQSVWK
ncbi:MAG TPA: glycosyltransferase [Symbiobacteriaceae bacterium]|nr:glycosyltransferase [Symbiobacteriaceae bacterium]